MDTMTSIGEQICGAPSLLILFGIFALVLIGCTLKRSQHRISVVFNGTIQFEGIPPHQAAWYPDKGVLILYGDNPTLRISFVEGIARNWGNREELSFPMKPELNPSSQKQDEEAVVPKVVGKKEDVLCSSSLIPSSTIYPTGFDVNKRDFIKGTELHRATENGEEAAVRELVRMGADINARNISKVTPLHMAAKRASVRCRDETSCFDTVDFLVEQGADVNAQDCEGRTFLHALFELGYGMTSSQLHKIAQKYGHLFSIPRDDGMTSLSTALKTVRNVDVSTLILLQNRGADFKAVDNEGRTVLWHALSGNKSVAVLSKLVEFGADHKRLDNSGWSVLHFAAFFSRADALAYFISIQLFPMINGMDRVGCTPLHLVGSMADRPGSKPLEVARLLLAHRASKTIKNGAQRTPYEEVINRKYLMGKKDFPDKEELLQLLR